MQKVVIVSALDSHDVSEKFSREKRLVSKQQFTNVFNQRKVISSFPIRAFVTPNSVGHARIGLAINKKAAGGQIRRNWVKRVIRESFRQQQNIPAYDIVFVLKRGASDITKEQLWQGLTQFWQKLNTTVS